MVRCKYPIRNEDGGGFQGALTKEVRFTEDDLRMVKEKVVCRMLGYVAKIDAFKPD